ncbi:MAG: hypothetical protein CSA38_05055 [Flavobacteriales bacterium]|nr:MAG: hypothetical protein CSA38_05055 [Flavobacteriales bacterium]
MGIFDKIFGKLVKSNDKEDNQDSKELDSSRFAKDLDYRFAQEFTRSGGLFNYCMDETEALHTLKQIYQVEGLQSTYCPDENLKNFLNVLNISYSDKLDYESDTAFITCEYLIAFNGKIMLSNQNIEHYNAIQLPKNIIVMATVSQIVSNFTDAMAKIKRQKNAKNVTSLSGNKSDLEISDAHHNKKIFLLLLED